MIFWRWIWIVVQSRNMLISLLNCCSTKDWGFSFGFLMMKIIESSRQTTEDVHLSPQGELLDELHFEHDRIKESLKYLYLLGWHISKPKKKKPLASTTLSTSLWFFNFVRVFFVKEGSWAYQMRTQIWNISTWIKKISSSGLLQGNVTEAWKQGWVAFLTYGTILVLHWVICASV